MTKKKLVSTTLAALLIMTIGTGCSKATEKVATTEARVTDAATIISETAEVTTKVEETTASTEPTTTMNATDATLLGLTLFNAYSTLDAGTIVPTNESLSFATFGGEDWKKAMDFTSGAASVYTSMTPLDDAQGITLLNMAMLGDKVMMYTETAEGSSSMFFDSNGTRMYNNKDKTVMIFPSMGTESIGASTMSTPFDDPALTVTQNVVTVGTDTYTFERFSDEEKTCYAYNASGVAVFYVANDSACILNAFTKDVPADMFTEPVGYTAQDMTMSGNGNSENVSE